VTIIISHTVALCSSPCVYNEVFSAVSLQSVCDAADVGGLLWSQVMLHQS